VQAKDDQPILGEYAKRGPLRADELSPTPIDTKPRSSSGAVKAGLPLLLVDIDGVISLFAFEADARPEGSFHSIDGIPHFLSSTAATYLLALSSTFELVWASGWEEKANEYLPHLLGLPALPYLSFERSPGRANAHWKLDAIDAYAGIRPMAWIDDAFNDACHEWAHARPAPTLLVKTAPATGLTEVEHAELIAFSDACRSKTADVRRPES
jgi:hypothetical protein